MNGENNKLPVAIVGASSAFIIDAAGVVETCSLQRAQHRLLEQPHLLCNAPQVARRLGLGQLRAFDALELFAFFKPAQFCVPTISGLLQALKIQNALPLNHDIVTQAKYLQDCVDIMLAGLAAPDYAFSKRAKAIASYMKTSGWVWGERVYNALQGQSGGDIAVWRGLDEWEDKPPRAKPDDMSVETGEALSRLSFLLGEGAEHREPQDDYTREACFAFSHREVQGAPNMIALEAGTGIGKTLGYIAPASLWAEKNDGAVWLSTYTKNLQRQIDQELKRLFKNEGEHNKKIVIRKGRENYLCLLNLEEALFRGKGKATTPLSPLFLGLVLRWATYSRDGDMVGGDFPSWLAAYFGASSLSAISDRRGECIYSACQHYRKCFVERSKKRAKHADLVVTNHALVIHEASLNGEEEDFPRRFVFDEGHHLFDAADSAFAISLSGQEAFELRRWLCGTEGRGGRTRGLHSRLDDLTMGDKKTAALIEDIVAAASILPEENWLSRLQSGMPQRELETFLWAVRSLVYKRSDEKAGAHSLETGLYEPLPELITAAQALQKKLIELVAPMKQLVARLRRKLETEAEDLSSADRGRLDSVARSINQRADVISAGWVAMLGIIGEVQPPEFVHWYFIERGQFSEEQKAREFDIGMKRHWLDPTKPLAANVLEHAHGVIITSATLRDKTLKTEDTDTEGENTPFVEDDWREADVRIGANHMILPPRRKSLPSPFDYAKNTRVFIVGDVNRNNENEVADAYRSLFQASGGGGLGLFTAISRLKRIYHKIARPLEEGGISLLAQHIDPMDAGSLVDMFKDDPSSCLLGTDAMRDGVDVPGEALKLIVFDRVPWARPDILHKARKAYLSAIRYDEMLVRLRLKQAFGRLVRRKNDRGVFIMLEGRTPTRLLDAFPSETPVQRLGLREAISLTKEFLST